MAQFFNEKSRKLIEDYDQQPCGKSHRIKLDELTYNIAKFSMEVSLRDCVVDHDGVRMMQGGVVALIADFAGVYLARMHSESQFITKLGMLELRCSKPIILGIDKKIIVRALINTTIGRKIFVDVLAENENRELKAVGKLLFIEKKEPV